MNDLPPARIVPAPSAYAANDGCLIQDLAGARRRLDAAGWLPGPDGIRRKDGVRLTILFQTSANAVRKRSPALIAQWWSAIGIETELRRVDVSVFFGGDSDSPDTYQKFFADVQMYAFKLEGADAEAYLGSGGAATNPGRQARGARAGRYGSPGRAMR